MTTIVIRPAAQEDAGAIYDLLAAEGHWRSLSDIANRIAGYTVLFCTGELAAVAAGFSDEKSFIAVHPGYPERLVSGALAGMLAAADARRRAQIARLAACEEIVNSFEEYAAAGLCGGRPAC